MKKKKEKTTRSLLGAWVCELANNLCNESEIPMTKSEAFRKAHMARELLERLGEGVVTFEYEKKDGTRRTARGTLCKGVDVAFDTYETPTKPPQGEASVTPPRGRRRGVDPTNFTYWDLEEHGFRTFSAARLVKIIAVAIPNYRENENHELIEFV